MEKSFIVVDTDILIDVSRGVSQATEELEKLEESKTLAISVITKFELMVGCNDKKELKELKEFLEPFEIFHLSEAISSKAVELFDKFRLSHDVKIANMLIASTAITYNIELISKNQKDFKFIDELQLMGYFAN
jgi:predicted nucleic acid-binding protein